MCSTEVPEPQYSTSLNKENNLKCPEGDSVVQINQKLVCRKLCPHNWTRESELKCGAHEYCKEEFPDSSTSDGGGEWNKTNSTNRFYCETPRCDENDQVRMTRGM